MCVGGQQNIRFEQAFREGKEQSQHFAVPNVELHALSPPLAVWLIMPLQVILTVCAYSERIMVLCPVVMSHQEFIIRRRKYQTAIVPSRKCVPKVCVWIVT